MLLYSNSVKSIANVIGMALGVTSKAIIRRFPSDFFKHVYMDTRLVELERVRAKKTIKGFKLPAIAFKPELNIEDLVYTSQEFHQPTLTIFNNGGDGVKMEVDSERTKINFEVKLKVETRLKMYDTLNFMKNKFPFNNFVTSPSFILESAMPTDMVEMLMMVLGYPLNVSGVRSFLAYLNASSAYDFTYKVNPATGKAVIFLQFPTTFQLFFDGLPGGETGMKNHVSADNYITFTANIEFWQPATYKILAGEINVGGIDMLKLDSKFVTVAPEEQYGVAVDHYVELYTYLLGKIGNDGFMLSSQMTSQFGSYINKLASTVVGYDPSVTNVLDKFAKDLTSSELNDHGDSIAELHRLSVAVVKLEEESQYNFDVDLNSLSALSLANDKIVDTFEQKFFVDVINILHPHNTENPNYDAGEDLEGSTSLYNALYTGSPLYASNAENPNLNLFDIKDLSRTSGDDEIDVDYQSSFLEETLSYIPLNFTVYGKATEVYNGKSLYLDEEFLSDINVLIDKLELADVLEDNFKDVVTYCLANNIRLDSIFSVYARMRSAEIDEKSVSYNFNWRTLTLSIDKPLYNVVYNVLIYVDKVLYQNILDSL